MVAISANNRRVATRRVVDFAAFNAPPAATSAPCVGAECNTCTTTGIHKVFGETSSLVENMCFHPSPCLCGRRLELPRTQTGFGAHPHGYRVVVVHGGRRQNIGFDARPGVVLSAWPNGRTRLSYRQISATRILAQRRRIVFILGSQAKIASSNSCSHVMAENSLNADFSIHFKWNTALFVEWRMRSRKNGWIHCSHHHMSHREKHGAPASGG